MAGDADCKNSNFPNSLPAVLIPATSCFPAASGRQITGKLSAKFFRRLLCTRACGTAQNRRQVRLLLQCFAQSVYGLIVPAPSGAVRHRKLGGDFAPTVPTHIPHHHNAFVLTVQAVQAIPDCRLIGAQFLFPLPDPFKDGGKVVFYGIDAKSFHRLAGRCSMRHTVHVHSVQAAIFVVYIRPLLAKQL